MALKYIYNVFTLPRRVAAMVAVLEAWGAHFYTAELATAHRWLRVVVSGQIAANASMKKSVAELLPRGARMRRPATAAPRVAIPGSPRGRTRKVSSAESSSTASSSSTTAATTTIPKSGSEESSEDAAAEAGAEAPETATSAADAAAPGASAPASAIAASAPINASVDALAATTQRLSARAVDPLLTQARPSRPPPPVPGQPAFDPSRAASAADDDDDVAETIVPTAPAAAPAKRRSSGRRRGSAQTHRAAPAPPPGGGSSAPGSRAHRKRRVPPPTPEAPPPIPTPRVERDGAGDDAHAPDFDDPYRTHVTGASGSWSERDRGGGDANGSGGPRWPWEDSGDVRDLFASLEFEVRAAQREGGGFFSGGSRNHHHRGARSSSSRRMQAQQAQHGQWHQQHHQQQAHQQSHHHQHQPSHHHQQLQQHGHAHQNYLARETLVGQPAPPARRRQGGGRPPVPVPRFFHHEPMHGETLPGRTAQPPPSPHPSGGAWRPLTADNPVPHRSGPLGSGQPSATTANRRIPRAPPRPEDLPLLAHDPMQHRAAPPPAPRRAAARARSSRGRQNQQQHGRQNQHHQQHQHHQHHQHHEHQQHHHSRQQQQQQQQPSRQFSRRDANGDWDAPLARPAAAPEIKVWRPFATQVGDDTTAEFGSSFDHNWIDAMRRIASTQGGRGIALA
jgi:hypothetical protein